MNDNTAAMLEQVLNALRETKDMEDAGEIVGALMHTALSVCATYNVPSEVVMNMVEFQYDQISAVLRAANNTEVH
jgi:hypothetical protein